MTLSKVSQPDISNPFCISATSPRSVAPQGLCDTALPFLACFFFLSFSPHLPLFPCSHTASEFALHWHGCCGCPQRITLFILGAVCAVLVRGELCGLLAQPQAPRLLWGFLARKRRSLPSGSEQQVEAPGPPRASSFVCSVPNWSREGPTPAAACLHFFFQTCAQTYFRPVDHNHRCPQTSHSSDFLISHVSPCLHPLSAWPCPPKALPCTPAPPAWHNQWQAQIKRRKQLQAVSGAKAEHQTPQKCSLGRMQTHHLSTGEDEGSLSRAQGISKCLFGASPPVPVVSTHTARAARWGF